VPPRKSAVRKPKAGNKPIPDDSELVFEALRGAKGNVAEASKVLGVKTYTLHYWLNSDPERRQLLDLIRIVYDDAIIDLALTALEKNLKSKDGRVRNMAINTAFKYMGKRRGYVPASYNVGENTGEITVKVVRE
jgi:hypothetical protein